MYFFPHGITATIGPGCPQYRGFTITHRRSTLDKTPLEEWSENSTTHSTKKRHVHDLDGIRNSNPSKLAATTIGFRTYIFTSTISPLLKFVASLNKLSSKRIIICFLFRFPNRRTFKDPFKDGYRGSTLHPFQFIVHIYPLIGSLKLYEPCN